MIFYSKNKVRNDELTFLSTPKLLYICEMDTVESCMAHRIIHSHEFLELLYIFEGSGLIEINKTDYAVTRGDLAVYNAGTIHDEKPGTTKIGTLCIGVSHLSLPKLPPNALLPREASPVIHFGHDMALFIEKLFKEMFTLMSSPSEDHEVICNYIMLLLLSIVRETGKKTLDRKETVSTRASEICEKVKDYIAKNYTETLSNTTISDAVSVSPFHMSRVFKQETGYTPMQYMTQLRLGKAQTLLCHTDMPITQIAYSVGYNSCSSFNYSFIKHLGLPPGEYRKLYRL